MSTKRKTCARGQTHSDHDREETTVFDFLVLDALAVLAGVGPSNGSCESRAVGCEAFPGLGSAMPAVAKSVTHF